jgi:predicted aconitase with swiveling domain
MTTLKGKAMLGGKGQGPALVTRMPLNVTASFSKPVNLIPGRRAEIRDSLHELFGQNVQGTVLIFPACIGSTFTGMVLMQLMSEDHAPAAIIVQNADSLLVSGAVLAEVWFNKGIPVIEYEGEDIYEKVKNGDRVEIRGDTGEIIIGEA